MMTPHYLKIHLEYYLINKHYKHYHYFPNDDDIDELSVVGSTTAPASQARRQQKIEQFVHNFTFI